ncbi:MAG: GAF domain-containing protein [Candidatus Cloacimonetes bacterium]|nr:GAF domain-containing protein [Candidatus Cloacimonadota bacterium]
MKTCLDILCPFPAETLAGRLAPWECELRRFEDPLDLLPVPEAPTVLLCDKRLLANAEVARGVLARFNPLHLKVVYLGNYEDWGTAGLMDFVVNAALREDAQAGEVFIAVRSALNSLERGRTLSLLESKLYQFNDDFEKINAIGKALTAERDLNKLLRLMLEQSMALTDADAGSIYLVEEADGAKQLRFKITENKSISANYGEFVMPMTTKSIAGYVACTGIPLLLNDVYALSPDLEYSFTRTFDEKTGYRTGSMLVVPMVDHKDRILGVIQLINRKSIGDALIGGPADFERLVIPFMENHKDFIMAIAGEAAVALENSQLYDSINRLLEGLVEASVTAIESRDPTTSGHSFRVAAMTVRLAETVDTASEGPYAGQRFESEHLREIRYASLLHDFGKVGVREEVLVKARKLYDRQFISIQTRFHWLRRDTEARFAERKLQLIREEGEKAITRFAELDRELAHTLEKLDGWYEMVCKANEPSVLAEDAPSTLEAIHHYTYLDPDGNTRPLLDSEELQVLKIPRGTLTVEDRKDIESHVLHTWEFLRRIPWTQELARVPEIAAAHHEYLNGRGYPRGLAAADIPVGSRMMTISDIYDALTANDRPYKRAVPHQKALDILGFEIKDGKVDADLFDIFVSRKVWTVLEAHSA